MSNNGSYDRRAPSPSSQIITLERLLEESEEREEKQAATIALLKKEPFIQAQQAKFITEQAATIEELKEVNRVAGYVLSEKMVENAKLKRRQDLFEAELREMFDYTDVHITDLLEEQA